MVIHLVHQNIQGQLAVVAILLNVSDTPNPLIETLKVVGLPKIPGKPLQHATQIDINQLLPEDKSYYTFEGSLTTPPCTEGVKWIILKQQQSISAAQLALYHALHPENARPLQPLNDRQVFSSD
jgi:carbonic anhydrase